jgi:hypothetical protein
MVSNDVKDSSVAVSWVVVAVKWLRNLFTFFNADQEILKEFKAMKLAVFVVALVTTIAWRRAEGASFEHAAENGEEISDFSHSRVRRADTLS